MRGKTHLEERIGESELGKKNIETAGANYCGEQIAESLQAVFTQPRKANIFIYFRCCGGDVIGERISGFLRKDNFNFDLRGIKRINLSSLSPLSRLTCVLHVPYSAYGPTKVGSRSWRSFQRKQQYKKPLCMSSNSRSQTNEGKANDYDDD